MITLLIGIIIAFLLGSLDDCFTFKSWFKGNVSYLVMLIVCLVILILLFPVNRIAYEFSGVQKYLNKEMIIETTTIKYNKQNQPIDTTYTFKYNK